MRWKVKLTYGVLVSFLMVGVFTGSGIFAAEQKIVTWWTEYTEPTTIQAMKDFIENPFEAQFPGIDLKIENFGDYERILRTAMATGSGPDVIDLHGPSWAIEYHEADMLLSLDEFSSEYGWNERIFPWALDCSKIGGELYSLPVHFETEWCWYNETMFQDHGWTMPQDWDELVALCQEIDAAGVIPYTFGSSDFPSECWIYSIFFNYVTGAGNMKKVLTGQMKWTDPPVRNAIEKLNYLWQQGWISRKQSHALTMDDAWGLWSAQQAAMKMEGTWALQYIDSSSQGFTWNWAVIPPLSEDAEPALPIGIGSSIAVNANTKVPEATGEFLNFLYAEPKRAAEVIAAVKGEFWLPIGIRKDDFPPGMDQRFLAAFDLISNSMDGQVGYLSWTFYPPKTDAWLYENLSSVFLGTMSIDQYLGEAQNFFEEELAQGKVPPLP